MRIKIKLILNKKIFILDSQKNNESLLNNNYSELFFNLLPIQISPTTPINNFYQGGDLSQTFTLKSAFSGGNAGGTEPELLL